jgi:hypothetical protein
MPHLFQRPLRIRKVCGGVTAGAPRQAPTEEERLKKLREYAEYGGLNSTYQWALDTILAQRDALRTIAVHGDETPCDAGCAASMKATARAVLAAVVSGSGTPEGAETDA